jgi:hypothetical protein
MGKKKDSGAGDFAAAAPSSNTFDGERWEKSEDLGELVAFVGIGDKEVDTQHGPATAADVDYIVILTGDNADTVYEDQLVFGQVLAPSIYNAQAPNGVVLGRLSQGEASKGKNAPWVLEEPSKKDHKTWLAFAEKYATRRKSGKIVIATDDISF